MFYILFVSTIHIVLYLFNSIYKKEKRKKEKNDNRQKLIFIFSYELIS
jgi:hypothetical protein